MYLPALIGFGSLALVGAARLWFAQLLFVPGWLAWIALVLGAIFSIHEAIGKPLPFLRWSFVVMGLRMKHMLREWQIGDGREEAVAQHVIATAPAGDLDAAIAAIDAYAYQKKFLINVGDEKGKLLDAAVLRVQPKLVIEVGAYVGYSALRIARQLPPGGKLISIEFSPANAAICRRVIAHAGVADRVTFVDGTLGDGGKTLAHLATACGLIAGAVDLVFLDHDKDVYLSDLQLLLAQGWLHPGSVVVADNVGFPGAPAYRAYMTAEEGKRWQTRTHETHVEYQSVIKDLVLESTLLA